MALNREDLSALVLRVEADSQALAPLVIHHSDLLASCGWQSLSKTPAVTTGLAVLARWQRAARSRDALRRLLDSYPVGEIVVCYETHGIPVAFCHWSLLKFGVNRVLRTALTSAVLRESGAAWRKAADGELARDRDALRLRSLFSFLSAMLGAAQRVEGREESKEINAGSFGNFKLGKRLDKAPADLENHVALDVEGFSYLACRNPNTVVYRTSAGKFFMAEYSAVGCTWYEASNGGDTSILCRVPGKLAAWPPIVTMLRWAHTAPRDGRKMTLGSVCDLGFFRPAIELLNTVEGVLTAGLEEIKRAPKSLLERKDMRDKAPLAKDDSHGVGILQAGLHTASPTYCGDPVLALSVLFPATRSIEYRELGMLLKEVGPFPVKDDEKWDNIKIASTYFSAMNFGTGIYGIDRLIHTGRGFLVEADEGGILSYPTLGFALVSMPKGLPDYDAANGPTYSPIAADEGRVPILRLYSGLGVLGTPDVVERLAEDLDIRPLHGLSRLSERALTILRGHFGSSRETLQFPGMMNNHPLSAIVKDDGPLFRSVLGVLALCGVNIAPGSTPNSFFTSASSLAKQGGRVRRSFTSPTTVNIRQPVELGGPVGVASSGPTREGTSVWVFWAAPSWRKPVESDTDRHDDRRDAFILDQSTMDIVKNAETSTSVDGGNHKYDVRLASNGRLRHVHLSTSRVSSSRSAIAEPFSVS